MSHIKRSPSDTENEDNAMEWEEDKVIEKLDACVGVAPEYALIQNIDSVGTGLKRKYSFSSPMPAKISRNSWHGDQIEHPSCNEASPCNDHEVTSEFSTTPSISQMMIDDCLDNSCQATNDNTSVMLTNDDTNYSKGDISTDSIPEIGAVSYPSRAILNVAKEKIIHTLDPEGLLLDSEGSSPDKDPPAKTKGSSPDTEGSSLDTDGSLPDTTRISEESRLTERTLSEIEESSPELEGSSLDTEGSSPDTETPLANTPETHREWSETERISSDTEGSSPDEEGSSPDEKGSSPDEEGSSPDEEGSSPNEEGSSPNEEDPSNNSEVISLRQIPPGFADLSNRSLEILRNHLKSHKKYKLNDIYKYFEFLLPDKELSCKICEVYASELSPPISPRDLSSSPC